MLADHADARCDRLFRVVKAGRLLPNAKFAVAGLKRPVEDAHQGGLPRPVLPDDRVDGAGFDDEIDVLQGGDVSEPLGDAAHLDRIHPPALIRIISS